MADINDGWVDPTELTAQAYDQSPYPTPTGPEPNDVAPYDSGTLPAPPATDYQWQPPEQVIQQAYSEPQGMAPVDTGTYGDATGAEGTGLGYEPSPSYQSPDTQDRNTQQQQDDYWRNLGIDPSAVAQVGQHSYDPIGSAIAGGRSFSAAEASLGDNPFGKVLSADLSNIGSMGPIGELAGRTWDAALGSIGISVQKIRESMDPNTRYTASAAFDAKMAQIAREKGVRVDDPSLAMDRAGVAREIFSSVTEQQPGETEAQTRARSQYGLISGQGFKGTAEMANPLYAIGPAEGRAFVEHGIRAARGGAIAARDVAEAAVRGAPQAAGQFAESMGVRAGERVTAPYRVIAQPDLEAVVNRLPDSVRARVDELRQAVGDSASTIAHHPDLKTPLREALVAENHGADYSSMTQVVQAMLEKPTLADEAAARTIADASEAAKNAPKGDLVAQSNDAARAFDTERTGLMQKAMAGDAEATARVRELEKEATAARREVALNASDEEIRSQFGDKGPVDLIDEKGQPNHIAQEAVDRGLADVHPEFKGYNEKGDPIVEHSNQQATLRPPGQRGPTVVPKPSEIVSTSAELKRIAKELDAQAPDRRFITTATGPNVSRSQMFGGGEAGGDLSMSVAVGKRKSDAYQAFHDEHIQPLHDLAKNMKDARDRLRQMETDPVVKYAGLKDPFDQLTWYAKNAPDVVTPKFAEAYLRPPSDIGPDEIEAWRQHQVDMANESIRAHNTPDGIPTGATDFPEIGGDTKDLSLRIKAERDHLERQLAEDHQHAQDLIAEYRGVPAVDPAMEARLNEPTTLTDAQKAEAAAPIPADTVPGEIAGTEQGVLPGTPAAERPAEAAAPDLTLHTQDVPLEKSGMQQPLDLSAESRAADVNPGAATNEALATAKGAEFQPGTGAALKPDEWSVGDRVTLPDGRQGEVSGVRGTKLDVMVDGEQVATTVKTAEMRGEAPQAATAEPAAAGGAGEPPRPPTAEAAPGGEAPPPRNPEDMTAREQRITADALNRIKTSDTAETAGLITHPEQKAEAQRLLETGAITAKKVRLWKADVGAPAASAAQIVAGHHIAEAALEDAAKAAVADGSTAVERIKAMEQAADINEGFRNMRSSAGRGVEIQKDFPLGSLANMNDKELAQVLKDMSPEEQVNRLIGAFPEARARFGAEYARIVSDVLPADRSAAFTRLAYSLRAMAADKTAVKILESMTAKERGVTVQGVLREEVRSSLLSSPSTDVKIAQDNLSSVFVKGIVQQPIAAVIDPIVSRLWNTGKQNDVRDVVPWVVHMGQGFGRSLIRDAAPMFLTGPKAIGTFRDLSDPIGLRAGRYGEHIPTIISDKFRELGGYYGGTRGADIGEMAGKIAALPIVFGQRAVGTVDTVFRHGLFEANLGTFAARDAEAFGLKRGTEEWAAFVAREGNPATASPRNLLRASDMANSDIYLGRPQEGSPLGGVQKYINYDPATSDRGRFEAMHRTFANIMFETNPFLSALTHGAQRGFRTSPLGLAGSLLPNSVLARVGAEIAPEERSMRIAQGLIGTVLSAAAFQKVMYTDTMTGHGPTDPQANIEWKAKGYQPYSILIGGEWKSYNNLLGLSVPLRFIADQGDTMKYDNPHHTFDIRNGIGAAGRSLAETFNYFNSMATIYDAINTDDPKKLDKAASNLLEENTPNSSAIRFVRNLQDSNIHYVKGAEDTGKMKGDPIFDRYRTMFPESAPAPLSPKGLPSLSGIERQTGFGSALEGGTGGPQKNSGNARPLMGGEPLDGTSAGAPSQTGRPTPTIDTSNFQHSLPTGGPP